MMFWEIDTTLVVGQHFLFANQKWFCSLFLNRHFLLLVLHSCARNGSFGRSVGHQYALPFPRTRAEFQLGESSFFSSPSPHIAVEQPNPRKKKKILSYPSANIKLTYFTWTSLVAEGNSKMKENSGIFSLCITRYTLGYFTPISV